ncbi:hypothetical protein AYK24_00100 [Thermoplasmatales archaeon SG8-52-4]|nr:MAG: hypothetical protein AYK24_00100 [Thermoplasmatales archaeon SG8-52-4]
MNEKDFIGELNKFTNKIVTGEHFSLVRFFDGEWYILSDQYIDITEKCNGEWRYDPTNEADVMRRSALIDSLRYKDPTYYVGVMTDCACLHKKKHGGFQLMKDMAGQDDDHLTFASLFMNYNYYAIVLPRLIPTLYEKEKVLVINQKANAKGIPRTEKIIRVGTNAWIQDIDLAKEIAEYAATVNGKYFLMAAGPLANIIIHKCHQENKNNTYINIGSMLDPMMFDEPTRWYHHDQRLKNHICQWV